MASKSWYSPWHEAVQSCIAAKAADLWYPVMAHLLVRCSLLGSQWVLSGQLRLDILQTATLQFRSTSLMPCSLITSDGCHSRAAVLCQGCAEHQRDPHAQMLPTLDMASDGRQAALVGSPHQQGGQGLVPAQRQPAAVLSS